MRDSLAPSVAGKAGAVRPYVHGKVQGCSAPKLNSVSGEFGDGSRRPSLCSSTWAKQLGQAARAVSDVGYAEDC
jgi:hypothetical protein